MRGGIGSIQRLLLGNCEGRICEKPACYDPGPPIRAVRSDFSNVTLGCLPYEIAHAVTPQTWKGTGEHHGILKGVGLHEGEPAMGVHSDNLRNQTVYRTTRPGGVITTSILRPGTTRTTILPPAGTCVSSSPRVA